MIKKRILIDSIFSIGILIVSFAMSVLFQEVFNVEEHITALFVFAVFMISYLTNGYLYGIIASIISVLAVNYAFTFPYFVFDFVTPVNLISAIVMIIISILTSTITTKIKYQEAMKAESEKERTRANLLRAISHDLRTPLTNIYGSATVLLENDECLSKNQKDIMLKGIKDDSEWLVRMVENLLSITRINSGQVKILKTPMALDELIGSVILKFKKRYPSYTLNLDLPDDMVIIPMDALLIEQVILNMLENSIIHGKNISKLTLKIIVQDKKAIFNIIDDGCGIPEDKISRIFNGYYSKGEVVDGLRRNTGIGLSVCATIIKAHGGKIMVRNNIDSGVTFTFILDMEDDANEK